MFVADTTTRCPLHLLGHGWAYAHRPPAFDRHLFVADAGCPAHLLGTDALGRDMLSRILVGSRLTLLMAGLVVAASVAIGTTASAWSPASYGGWWTTGCSG